MPDLIPCRIVENSGDIHDGHVALDYRETVLGFKVAAPALYLDHLAGRFKFSHFTERGAAVYLEVE